MADTDLLLAMGDSSALAGLPDLRVDEFPSLDLNAMAFVDHPRVQYWTNYFSTTARERFQTWLDRMPRYEGLIRDRLSRERLPGDLIFLALIESGFSNSAVSTSKAVGMWQFMAPTGKDYGLQVDAWRDERRDPVRATDAAARHLRDLTNRFSSYYLAAAAYNAGAGKVGRGLNQIRIPFAVDTPSDEIDLTSGDAFFSLADTRLIMQETKDYVPKLIAATLIAGNPEQYGFILSSEAAPFPLDSVIVAGGTGLDLIARLADTTLDALRDLNPHLLHLVAPLNLALYPVRVPAGTADLVAARYAEVPLEERAALSTWKVKAGETVASIAAATGASIEDIKTVNGAARAGRLNAGTTLYIPRTSIPISLLRDVGTATVTSTHVVRSGETLSGIAKKYRTTVAVLSKANNLSGKKVIRTGQRLTVPGATAAGVPTAPAAPARVTATSTTHLVSAGETLSSLARSYHTTVTALQQTNQLTDDDVIKIGQRLTIPGSNSVSTPASSGSSASTHVVAKGETISGIAQRYGVRQADLITLNKLNRSGKIVVGQRLRIPG